MKGARLNRQTFEGVAAAIKRVVVDWNSGTQDKALALLAIEDVANNLADDFAEAANNFDRALFLKNCGFLE